MVQELLDGSRDAVAVERIAVLITGDDELRAGLEAARSTVVVMDG
jgi:hypothetical protein